MTDKQIITTSEEEVQQAAEGNGVEKSTGKKLLNLATAAGATAALLVGAQTSAAVEHLMGDLGFEKGRFEATALGLTFKKQENSPIVDIYYMERDDEGREMGEMKGQMNVLELKGLLSRNEYGEFVLFEQNYYDILRDSGISKLIEEGPIGGRGGDEPYSLSPYKFKFLPGSGGQGETGVDLNNYQKATERDPDPAVVAAVEGAKQELKDFTDSLPRSVVAEVLEMRYYIQGLPEGTKGQITDPKGCMVLLDRTSTETKKASVPRVKECKSALSGVELAALKARVDFKEGKKTELAQKDQKLDKDLEKQQKEIDALIDEIVRSAK